MNYRAWAEKVFAVASILMMLNLLATVNNLITQKTEVTQQLQKEVNVISRSVFSSSLSQHFRNGSILFTSLGLQFDNQSQHNNTLNTTKPHSEPKPPVSLPIIVGPEIGRFGNLIFQYIAQYLTAQQTNHINLVRKESALRRMFPNLKGQLIESSQIKDYKTTPVHEKEAGIYTSTIVNVVKGMRHVSICCYFQSWKYMKDRENEVRELLHFDDKLQRDVNNYIRAEAQKHFNKILSECKRTKSNVYKLFNTTKLKSVADFTYVGLHYRKGDTMSSYQTKRGYVNAPVEYIQKAMQYYRTKYDNVLFYICSDSISWCRSQINSSHDDVIFATQNVGNYMMDFVTLAQCNHTIITTGTFGWWAAWLSKGEVIYYSGFPVEKTEIGNKYSPEDYYLPSWIPMK